MIDREGILSLAALARMKVSEEEVGEFQKDISNILEYVGQINSTEMRDGGSLDPVSYNVMREDVVRLPSDPMAEKESQILGALPEREGDYAVVRKIIQKDE